MPFRIHLAALCAFAFLLVSTASAPGSELWPLRGGAQVSGGEVRDRVLTEHSMSARAARVEPAGSDTSRLLLTRDGTPIAVTLSPSYSDDQVTAQSYVDFVGDLPHGSELAKLRLHLAPPDEVVERCGGEPVVACYDPAAGRITIPGEPVEDEGAASAEYVLAHEYGHHVAAYRSHHPFSALALGPKYWSSYVRACSGVNDGRYSATPSGGYRRSPGENWAETYARLRFPDAPWTFAPSLAPDSAALAAARRDVTQPWRRYRTRVVRGRLGSSTRFSRHSLTLTLDGAFKVALQGPRSAQLDVRLLDNRGVKVRTHDRGSRDVLRLPVACRDRDRERLTLEVVGRGKPAEYRLTVTYAG